MLRSPPGPSGTPTPTDGLGPRVSESVLGLGSGPASDSVQGPNLRHVQARHQTGLWNGD